MFNWEENREGKCGKMHNSCSAQLTPWYWYTFYQLQVKVSIFGQPPSQSGTGYRPVFPFILLEPHVPIARHPPCVFVHGEVVVEAHVGTQHYLVHKVECRDTPLVAGPSWIICDLKGLILMCR